tara:strand:- start:310 stop:1221 length:912 start_codon:yes stop_codon:yes gene_type:complete
MSKILLIVGFALFITLPAFASSVYISTCNSVTGCSDKALAKKALNISDEDVFDVLFYNQLKHATYHWHVDNAYGQNIPGMRGFGARLVGDLGEAENAVVGEFVKFTLDGFTYSLKQLSTTNEQLGGYNLFKLSDVYSDKVNPLAAVATGVPTLIQSNISTALSNVHASAYTRIVDAMTAVIKDKFGQETFLISGQLRNQHLASVEVMFTEQANKAIWGVVTELSRNGKNVIAEVQKIVLIEDSNVIFEMPYENGFGEFESLVGRRFYSNAPQALQPWFQTFSVDLSWQDKCSMCLVSIVDLEP